MFKIFVSKLIQRERSRFLLSGLKRYHRINEEEVKKIWRSADAVTLDVDSTVCVDEGIDELAAFMNVGDKVAQLTREAMAGRMTFQESLDKRLSIIRPSRQNVTQFITKHPPQLTEGIRELVELLQERKIAVYLISGGFQSIIEPIAEELNIPRENICANRFLFYYDGGFAGFDKNQPTSESGGKPKVIQQLKDKHNYKTLVHIGDGVTDLEACPPADAFIGFGGNQVRKRVEEGSKWFVTTFGELTEELHRKSIKLS